MSVKTKPKTKPKPKPKPKPRKRSTNGKPLAETKTADQLRAEMEDVGRMLADELAALEARRDELLEKIGRISHASKALDGGPGA